MLLWCVISQLKDFITECWAHLDVRLPNICVKKGLDSTTVANLIDYDRVVRELCFDDDADSNSLDHVKDEWVKYKASWKRFCEGCLKEDFKNRWDFKETEVREWKEITVTE